MDWFTFLTTNAALIGAHPIPFVVLAVLAFVAGWGAASLYFKQELNVQRARVEHWKEKADGAPNASSGNAVGFDFPKAGFYGLNILSESLSSLEADLAYSMTAKVPTGMKLRIHMVGPAPETLQDVMGAWRFNIMVKNWSASSYDEDRREQWFEADAGEADLQFFASRAGDIVISVYEGGREPAWTKTLTVKRNRGTLIQVPPISPTAFVPNDDQEWIIRILRQLDGEWFSFSDLRGLPTQSAWQDVAEGVSELADQGWLEWNPENVLRSEPGKSFRLKGPGLAHARSKGYPTAAQITAGLGRQTPRAQH